MGMRSGNGRPGPGHPPPPAGGVNMRRGAVPPVPLTIYDVRTAGPARTRRRKGARSPKSAEQVKMAFLESARRGGPGESSRALVFREKVVRPLRPRKGFSDTVAPPSPPDKRFATFGAEVHSG